jgi:probable phosphoglycerate mutase
MGQVILIRPGRTEFDKQHRIQGGLNLPLSEEGLEDVSHLVNKLESLKLDLILSSTTDPALSTAQAISEHLQITHKECPGLDNIAQGLWEGLEVEEVKRKFFRIYKQWEETPESVCPPQGETLSDAMVRIQKTLQKHLKKNQTLGVVVPEPLGCIVKGLLTGVPPCIKGFCQNKNPIDLIEIIPFMTEKEVLANGAPAAPVEAKTTHFFFF